MVEDAFHARRSARRHREWQCAASHLSARRDLISRTRGRLTPETIAIDPHSNSDDQHTAALGAAAAHPRGDVRSEPPRTHGPFWLSGGTIGPSDAVLGGSSTDTGGGSIPPGVFDALVEMGEIRRPAWPALWAAVVAARLRLRWASSRSFRTCRPALGILTGPTWRCWCKVALDGGTTINDLSSHGGTAAHQLERGHRQRAPGVRCKTRSGHKHRPRDRAVHKHRRKPRFSRPAGEGDDHPRCTPTTSVLNNFAASGWMWHWRESTYGRIAEMVDGEQRRAAHLHRGQPGHLAVHAVGQHALLHPVHGSETPTTSTLTGCGRAPARSRPSTTPGTYSFYTGASSISDSSGRQTNTGPRRSGVTKGVACARGSVPAAAFPTF